MWRWESSHHTRKIACLPIIINMIMNIIIITITLFITVIIIITIITIVPCQCVLPQVVERGGE